MASIILKWAASWPKAAVGFRFDSFLRTLATPEPIKDWSLTSLKEKLIKIGAKVISPGRYVAFQMAEVAIPRHLFADILRLIARLLTRLRSRQRPSEGCVDARLPAGALCFESLDHIGIEPDGGGNLGAGELGSPFRRRNIGHVIRVVPSQLAA